MNEAEVTQTIKAMLSDLDAEDYGERIETLRRIIGVASDRITGEVAAARASGWSWGKLAPVLGTTRQAAHERFSS